MSSNKNLHAWIENEYVGYFEREPIRNQISFHYADDAKHLVSLSLPREGLTARMAAENFLAGLAPEVASVRENMRKSLGAESTDTWDLLSASVIDLPGGILLSKSEELADRGLSLTRRASLNSIEARIVNIQHDGYDSNEARELRFSLAGVQAKFALTEFEGTYYWPDGATPSTHIVKPASEAHAGLNEVEVRALELADAMGLNAAAAEVKMFGSQEAFMTERFDRTLNSDGVASRIHMEDFGQALGRTPASKYHVTAVESVKLLSPHGEDLSYALIEQLAFNVTIGNVDAHAKNYSLMHDSGKVLLSPLYDTVPIALYPVYSQKLSMKIGSEKFLKGVMPSSWAHLAHSSGLDEDRVLGVVRAVNENFLEHADKHLGGTELAKLRKSEFEELFSRAERTLNVMPPTV